MGAVPRIRFRMNSRLRASRFGSTLLRSLAVSLLLAVAIVAPAAAQLPAPTPTPTPDPLLTSGPADAGQMLYAPGELIVGVRTAPAAGVSAASGLAVAAAVGAQVTEILDVTGPDDDIVAYVLSVPPGQEYEVAAALRASRPSSMSSPIGSSGRRRTPPARSRTQP